MPPLARMIQAWFSSPLYYVRISRAELIVRDVSNGRQWKDEPLVGLQKRSGGGHIVAAVGATARGKGLDVINPFDHPRSIVNDFVAGEKLLQYAFSSVHDRKLVALAPIAIVQVTDELVGGLTVIEHRALQEMATGAGAKQAHIWEGRTLSDVEVQQGIYKSM